MFKKLFRNLTQSKEEAYLEEMEAGATALVNRGAVQMASIQRRFSILKKAIDEKIDSNDASLLEVENFDEHAKRICDEVQAKIKQLAGIESELAEVVSSRDLDRFNSHFAEWKDGNLRLMRAFAVLHHAATGESPKDAIELEVGAKTTLDETVERLAVEIRTAERIKYELGG